MSPVRPNDPALWFFLGAIVVSVPWSGFLSPPEGLSSHQLSNIGAIWRFVFGASCLIGAIGYGVGSAVCKSRFPRRISISIGVVVGLGIVATSQLTLFSDFNFGPLALVAAVAGTVLGLGAGWTMRKAANHTFQRTASGGR